MRVAFPAVFRRFPGWHWPYRRTRSPVDRHGLLRSAPASRHLVTATRITW
ncbi:hypothetical protein NKH77_54910 [Streptomyces sp. M19]